jgi:hypothetical protein
MRLTENQKSKLIVDIINEGEYWEKKGVPTKQIELIIETSISDIAGYGASGFMSTLKKQIAGWVLRGFGMDDKGYMALVLQNAFATLKFSEYKKVFSDCEFTSGLIAKSLLNTFIDRFKTGTAYDNAFYDALQYSVIEAVNDNQTVEFLADKLHGTICDKLGDIREMILSKYPPLSYVI